MNQQIKAQWLRALRSGEYRQAHGQLRDGSVPNSIRPHTFAEIADIIEEEL